MWKLLLTVCLTALSCEGGSPPGDVVGKITVGYQGWFAAKDDGSPINGYWHWSHDWAQPPSLTNTAFRSFPDNREYTQTYPTNFPPLGNGQEARVFSTFNDQTIDTQFRWMAENGIHTAALQRFNPLGGEGPVRDAITEKVRIAAENRGVKFYIMYDVSDWINMQSTIREDWNQKMSRYTSSPAYARQNGMPVVCIWGFGFNDPQRPFTAAQALDVVQWFKSQNLYVIGGTPTHWRNGNEDSRPGFFEVYTSFHMISPWMVGRIGDSDGADHYYNNVNRPDQELINQLNLDYQPCVIPGDLDLGQRKHGDFMWRQFYNLVRVGVQGIYISMYDEYNEGNQIAKTAESQEWVPQGSNYKSLDEDGTRCTSDYYLRLTNDGGRMLRGEIPIQENRPTNPWP